MQGLEASPLFKEEVPSTNKGTGFDYLSVMSEYDRINNSITPEAIEEFKARIDPSLVDVFNSLSTEDQKSIVTLDLLGAEKVQAIIHAPSLSGIHEMKNLISFLPHFSK